MTFKSDRQRKAVMAKLNLRKGNRFILKKTAFTSDGLPFKKGRVLVFDKKVKIFGTNTFRFKIPKSNFGIKFEKNKIKTFLKRI